MFLQHFYRKLIAAFYYDDIWQLNRECFLFVWWVMIFAFTYLQAPLYYRNADGALVVYDITNRQSFESVKKWVNGEFGRDGIGMRKGKEYYKIPIDITIISAHWRIVWSAHVNSALSEKLKQVKYQVSREWRWINFNTAMCLVNGCCML